MTTALRELRGWSLVGGGWLVLALLHAVGWALIFRADWPGTLDLIEVDGSRAALLLALTVVIVTAARRFDLRRPDGLPIKLIIHAAVLLGVAAVHVGWGMYAISAFTRGVHPGRFLPLLTQQLVVHVFAYAIIVTSFYALAARRAITRHARHTAVLTQQLSRAQLELLTVQLHPHFLFNTLNSVAELVHRAPGKAAAVMRHLSSLLQLSLNRTPKQFVSIADELEFLSAYLEIQRTRFPEVTVEIACAPELKEVRVPHLLLQPLVENAFQHGLASRSAGWIRISIERRDASLAITITDNGTGLRAGARLRSGGRGISRTAERLAELFGDAASIDVVSNMEGGATTRVRLPVRAPTADVASSEREDVRADPADLPDRFTTGGTAGQLVRGLMIGWLVIAALLVLQDLVLWRLNQVPLTLLRHWLDIDLRGVLLAALASGALLGVPRIVPPRPVARAVGLHVIGVVLFTVTLNAIRQAIGLFEPQTQLISLATMYWVIQDFAVYGAVTAIAYGRSFYRELYVREAAAARAQLTLTEARVDLMRWRMQPFFVLPTLEAIASMPPERASDADQLIGRLGEFLRWTLDAANTHAIELQREADGLTAILSIHADLGLRVHPIIDVSASHSELVPPLLLSTVVALLEAGAVLQLRALCTQPTGRTSRMVLELVANTAVTGEALRQLVQASRLPDLSLVSAVVEPGGGTCTVELRYTPGRSLSTARPDEAECYESVSST